MELYTHVGNDVDEDGKTDADITIIQKASEMSFLKTRTFVESTINLIYNNHTEYLFPVNPELLVFQCV